MLLAFFAAGDALIGSLPALAEELVVKPVEAADLKPVAAIVDSVHHAFARTRIAGTIDGLSVDEGKEVKRGQVIAVVIDPKQPLEIDALDARIRSLEHERDLAAVDAKRYTSLEKLDAVSTSERDAATTKLGVLKNNLKALLAERDSAIQRRKEGQVLAPLDGRVLKVPVTNGSVVLPGEVVAEIAVDGYVLKLNVPERHARFLKVGDTLRVLHDSADDPRQDSAMIGTIEKLYPQLEHGRVIADVGVPDLRRFYVGERLVAYVPTSRRMAIFVPEAMLIHRYGLTYVRLKSGSEIVVQTGTSDERGVEILSGLQAGDVLVSP